MKLSFNFWTLDINATQHKQITKRVLREAVKKRVFYGKADRKEEGEEKDRREREEEEGITQLLPLYPMSIRLWHGVNEHGGHGHGQHKLCRLSPLSYQINLEFAQIAFVF